MKRVDKRRRIGAVGVLALLLVLANVGGVSAGAQSAKPGSPACPSSVSQPQVSAPQVPTSTVRTASTRGRPVRSSGVSAANTVVPIVTLFPTETCLIEYGLPTTYNPQFITNGPDGNLWFTVNQKLIARMDARYPHTVTLFSVPEANPLLVDLTVGPDRNIWFADYFGHIGRILVYTPNTVTLFATPDKHDAQQIETGPDGALWFTEYGAGRIGRIAPQAPNTITEYPVASGDIGLTGLVTGPDGNLWFTEQTGNHVDRILGHAPYTVTRYALPPHPGVYQNSNFPYWITVGPDGNLWFTMDDGLGGNTIGRFSATAPARTMTEFTVPTAPSQPFSLVTGPDHQLWYDVNGPDYTNFQTGANIQRMTLAAPGKPDQPTITQYPLANVPGWTQTRLEGMVSGPRNSMWIAEPNAHAIAQWIVPCAVHPTTKTCPNDNIG